MLKARTEFASALNQICAERGIEAKTVLETIKAAIVAAYRRDFGLKEGFEYEAEIDPESGEARLFSWAEGKGEKKKDITPPGFGRIATQVAKQVLLQKIREAEKTAIIEEYSQKIGTLLPGLILRFDKPNVIVDLDKTEAVMPPQEQVRSEEYRVNQRLTFYVKEVKDSMRGREVIVSRADKELVRSLFRREVPEVRTGAVEIMAIAREPGARSKVAVSSVRAGVDPVGSCVGQKGTRVQEVINELEGEKIDVIQYNEDPEKFITAALSPAEGVNVKVNQKKEAALVTVPDDQLSLAIGKDGQNVRLAAKLTGYKIDIKGAEKIGGEQESVLVKAGLAKRFARILAEEGVTTLEELEKKSPKELAAIKGLGPKALKKIAKIVK